MTKPRTQGDVRSESIRKNNIFAVGSPPDAKSGTPDAAANTVDQTRLKPCRGRPFGLQAELESESKVAADVRALPFPDPRFDAVISIHVLYTRSNSNAEGTR